MSYRTAGELAPAHAKAALDAERAAGLAPEPWVAESIDAGAPATEPDRRGRASRGGASDAFRPGGASDSFKR
jgi:hypothetical protein